MHPSQIQDKSGKKRKFNPKWLVQYIKEARDELKKVVWPSRKEAVKHTMIVIGVSVATAIFLGAIDYIMNIGLKTLID